MVPDHFRCHTVSPRSRPESVRATCGAEFKFHLPEHESFGSARPHDDQNTHTHKHPRRATFAHGPMAFPFKMKLGQHSIGPGVLGCLHRCPVPIDVAALPERLSSGNQRCLHRADDNTRSGNVLHECKWR